MLTSLSEKKQKQNALRENHPIEEVNEEEFTPRETLYSKKRTHTLQNQSNGSDSKPQKTYTSRISKKAEPLQRQRALSNLKSMLSHQIPHSSAQS